MQPETVELNRPWVPILAGALAGIALLIAVAVLVAENPALGLLPPVTSGDTSAFVAGTAVRAAPIAALFAAPLFVFAVALALAAPMWTMGQRLMLLAPVPLGGAVMVGASEAGFAAGGESGVAMAAGAAAAIALGAGGVVIATQVRAGVRRARADERP